MNQRLPHVTGVPSAISGRAGEQNGAPKASRTDPVTFLEAESKSLIHFAAAPEIERF